MAELFPETILRRASSLTIRVDADGQIAVEGPEGETACDAGHVLAVLNVFSTAVTVGEALVRLRTRVRGAQDWLDLTNTILQLHEAGILMAEGEARPAIDSEARGFAAPEVHVSMLNDRERTAAFLTAIQETVRPGDVVVDIGTGTGILAIAAARAGARHVYAIESSSIGQVANLMFEANGLASRITLLEGRSTHVELPEKADVLIGEIIRNAPLGERVLETFLDARTRFLKPDARFVPEMLSIFGIPIEIPAADLSIHTFTPEAAARWREAYGMDFSPLAVVAAEPGQSFLARRSEARRWRWLSDPIRLVDIDLRLHTAAEVLSTASAPATASGVINGLAIFFELRVSSCARLSTAPSVSGEHSHWRNPVEILPEALKVQAGDPLAVTYRYGVPGPRVEVGIRS